MKPTQAELTAIIDTCYDAVNASKVGVIRLKELPDGSTMLNMAAFQTFLALVGRLVPNVQAPATFTARQETPKEPWQSEEGEAD